MGLDGPGTTEDELWEIGSREEILEHLLDLADARLEARAAEIGEADWASSSGTSSSARSTRCGSST